MDREALRARLMTTFVGELEEHVQTMTRDLLAIEQDAAVVPERLASLFRTAHSLKGAARSVSIPEIESVCHQLESLLSAAREGRRPLDGDAVQRLFEAARAFDDAAARLRAHASLTPGPLQDLLASLTHPEDHRRQNRWPPRPAPGEAGADRPVPSLPTRDSSVRVSAETLDTLLAGSGELLIARRRAAAEHAEIASLHDHIRHSRAEWHRLERPLRKLLRAENNLLPRRAVAALERTNTQMKVFERRLDQLGTRLHATQHALNRAAENLEGEIRRARLLPFSHACEGLALAVRELGRADSTPVDVVVEGGDTLLDRFVLEGIRSPLLQLVRNAVVHGIEPPAERRDAGKPVRGRVTITATVHGDLVEIGVRDDGRGLDRAAISTFAQERGLPGPASDGEAVALIFTPGFSTATHITEMSGRGVGLDIVKHQVESLQGHVDAQVQPGRGLHIVMQVPLTLTTLRALLVRAGGQTFALPVASIRRLARPASTEFASAGERDVLLTNDAPVPAASLVDVLGIHAPVPPGDRVPVVIMRAGRFETAIVVQELLAEEELLVKSLGPRLKRVRHVAGATILPSGHVALILNAAAVVQSALTGTSRLRLSPHRTDRQLPVRRRLVLADDSVTTRTLERTILEAAGYDVVAAVDGLQAWELLQTADAELVVADVEMPRMDGFALCEAIRTSTRFRDLPVVLVTSLESEADRRRGLEAGASAYLPKSSFDQQLLVDTVARLL